MTEQPELWTLEFRGDAQVIATRADGGKRMVMALASVPICRTFLDGRPEPITHRTAADILLFRRRERSRPA